MSDYTAYGHFSLVQKASYLLARADEAPLRPEQIADLVGVQREINARIDLARLLAKTHQEVATA